VGFEVSASEFNGIERWHHAGIPDLGLSSSYLDRRLPLSLDRRIARSPSWPKTPAVFANELRRLAPVLAENGLFVLAKRTKKARLIVRTTRPERHVAEATNETNIPGG
jgi:hypothetical protein